MEVIITWDTIENLCQVIVHKTLLLVRNLGSALGSSHHSSTSPHNVVTPNGLTFTNFAQDLTLFAVKGRGRQFYLVNQGPDTFDLHYYLFNRLTIEFHPPHPRL